MAKEATYEVAGLCEGLYLASVLETFQTDVSTVKMRASQTPTSQG